MSEKFLVKFIINLISLIIYVYTEIPNVCLTRMGDTYLQMFYVELLNLIL